MASEQAILNMMGRALWDPSPTAGSDLRARQLATALGYPKTWRVVRTIEDAVVPHSPSVLQQQQQTHQDGDIVNNNDKDSTTTTKDANSGQEKETATTDFKMETNESTMALEEKAAETTTTTATATATTTTTCDKDAPPLESSNKVVTETKDEKAQTTEETSKEDVSADDDLKTDATSKEDVSADDLKANNISSSNHDVGGKKEDDDKMEIDQEETTSTKPIAEGESIESITTIDKPEATVQEATAGIDAATAKANDVSNSSNGDVMDMEKEANAEQTDKEVKIKAKATDDDDDDDTKKVPATIISTSKEPATAPAATNNEKVPATNTSIAIEEQPQPTTTTTTTKKTATKVIVDRIYAGKPGTDCDMWFNHYAAMQAAQQWDEIVNNSNNSESAASTTTQTQLSIVSPFHFKGGHLLPRMAKFEKNDKVEVYFENKWWDAKILRKKEHADGFRYQVYYNVDSSKQSGMDESLIRHRSAEKDPHNVATLLGFDAGWQAVSTGRNRWKITSPSGVTYQSKKAALKAIKDEATKAATAEVGDPPWRTTGHAHVGRLVLYTQEHAVSARRKIKVQQTGKVVGWISALDVDKAGEPGFVSETTGKPANLFHVEFDDSIMSPQHHPYPNYLVQSQDLEEFEVEACLIPEVEEVVGACSPSKKKARTKR